VLKCGELGLRGSLGAGHSVWSCDSYHKNFRLKLSVMENHALNSKILLG